MYVCVSINLGQYRRVSALVLQHALTLLLQKVSGVINGGSIVHACAARTCVDVHAVPLEVVENKESVHSRVAVLHTNGDAPGEPHWRCGNGCLIQTRTT